MQDLEDLEGLLQDHDLSHAARRGYYGLKVKIRHALAEECGQLPVRTQVEVAVPRTESEIVGWDPNRFMDALRASRNRDDLIAEGWTPPSDAPAGRAPRVSTSFTPAAPDREPSSPGTAAEPPTRVDPEVERAATALATKVWSQGARPRSELLNGLNQATADEYVTQCCASQVDPHRGRFNRTWQRESGAKAHYAYPEPGLDVNADDAVLQRAAALACKGNQAVVVARSGDDWLCVLPDTLVIELLANERENRGRHDLVST
jgi:hypothetical protein